MSALRPGAAVGARAGMDIGVALLTWLGLGFLVIAIGRGLLTVSRMVGEAVGLAWDAHGTPDRQRDVWRAGELFAEAVAQLFLVILMAIVARLTMGQAGPAAARATASLEELVASLRSSRLGAGFADWVAANAQSLVRNPRLRAPGAAQVVEAKGGAPVTPSQLRRAGGGGARAEAQAAARPTKPPVVPARAVPPGADPYAYYMQQARTVDVSTAPNAATFYSGPGNRALAEEFAAANGRTTLETTRGGAWLDNQRLFAPDSPLSPAQATDVWSTLSGRFAEQASGNAVGFVQGARPAGIFNTVEFPALQANPNVVNVITGGH